MCVYNIYNYVLKCLIKIDGRVVNTTLNNDKQFVACRRVKMYVYYINNKTNMRIDIKSNNSVR